MNSKLIERKPYMQVLRSLKEQHIIKVLTGMRRCGKSTLFEMIATEIQQTATKKQIQFYNFEDVETLDIGDFMQIHRHITRRLVAGKMNYIFLDEVQNIAHFERMVDSLYIRKNIDLYVTGSNAYLLSSELATLLTGRYIEINMLPFSFSEYYALSTPPNLSENASLAEFMYHGGIPQAVALAGNPHSQNNKFVEGVLNTILEKDIFQRHPKINKQAFKHILDFVLDSIGSLLSPRSISDTLRTNGTIIDKESVGDYLEYLTEAYILYRAPRYDMKGKRLLQTLDKYYLSDAAFRKVRLGRKMVDDRGHLLENAVYLELRRRNREVYVGKMRDTEVDFVAVDDNGYVSYYQVAFSVLDENTLTRELRPLLAIRDSNPKFLLSTDLDVNPVYEGIRKMNVADWLLNSP
jgi:predicted AAA+ superfamily ATPase